MLTRKKCLISITLRDTKEAIDKLVKVTKLGDIPVTCLNWFEKTVPNVHIGVIHPVSSDLDVTELLPLIKTKNDPIFDNDIEIIKIERLTKKVGIHRLDSQSIKIFFERPDLPKAVTIMHFYYKVNPFVSLPLQCYNCQRMGHTAKSCNAQALCMLCGGLHKKNDCQVPDESGHKCANCGGQHRANSVECHKYKEAKVLRK